jgi:hypothetical protein
MVKGNESMKVGAKFMVQVHFKGNTGGEILILRYFGSIGLRKIKFILEHRTDTAISDGQNYFWTINKRQFLSFKNDFCDEILASPQ